MTYVLVLALAAGVAGGLGAVVFRSMISAMNAAFFSVLLPLITVDFHGVNLGLILLPAIGAVMLAPVVYGIAPETRGTGIPEIMDAYTREKGRIRSRVAVLKIIVSAITIGSGGSAGREGPITQIGGASGSALGRILGLTNDQVKLLVVSGVAAGIAGTFNAPLGGALFAIEVLQRSFSWRGTPSIIVASVVGAGVASLFFGLSPVIPAPAAGAVSAVQLGTYALLGLAFGLLSFVWVKVFYFFQDVFARSTLTGAVKLLIGGASVGTIGMLLPSYGIFGVGYQGIDVVLAGGVTVGLALTMGIAKALATSLTIGSGASGGIFAPTLYLGATFGAALGLVFVHLAPGLSSPELGYAVAGMAALMGGAARAPLTAMVIVPELTGDSTIVPALMLSCILSYYVSSRLLRNSSIYTLKLEKRGIDIKRLAFPDYLNLVTAAEVAVKPSPVHEESTIADFLHDGAGETLPASPVVDRASTLVGSMTTARALAVPPGERGVVRVKDVMDYDALSVTSDTSVSDVAELMEGKGASVVYVVDGSPGRTYVGVLTLQQMLRARDLGKGRSDE